jgi:DNA repair exonuclease SbcCD nuclease subunit
MNGFIQTGDIHIGECRTIPDYLNRHQGVLDSITKQAQDSGLPLIIAGDLFHAKNTTHEERLLATKWLFDLETKQVPTILIAGNHDHLYGESTQLDFYQYCGFRNVRVFGWKPGVTHIGDIGFICLSWQSYTTKDIEKVVYSFLPQIQSSRHKVVVLHECIVGSEFDNGTISPKGTKLPDIPEITYWAIGDIHKRQNTNIDNGKYAGAPAMFKFDDFQEKGVLKVSLDSPQSPEFLEIYSKRLLVVSSVDEIRDDAHYVVVGSFEEVLKANSHDKVLRAKWANDNQGAIVYEKMSLVDGLPEFLASKGIEDSYQKMAIEWVTKEFGLNNLDTVMA